MQNCQIAHHFKVFGSLGQSKAHNVTQVLVVHNIIIIIVLGHCDIEFI